MDHDEARTRLLDAADALFYARGIQAVGMDDLRAASGVSLKRLYRCFPSKEDLIVEYLRRRDERWRVSLAEYVCAGSDSDQGVRPLRIFDWLDDWFRTPGFHGCAFINAAGELGAGSAAVAATAGEHKRALRRDIERFLRDVPLRDPQAVAEQLLLLIDGAITSAALCGNPDAAMHGRAAAEALLVAHPAR